MANLPLNETYTSPSGINFPNISAAFSRPQQQPQSLTEQLQSRGLTGERTPVPSFNQLNQGLTRQLPAPTAPPALGAQPLPADYSKFPGFRTGTVPVPGGPTTPLPNLETTGLRASNVYEGQYIIDTSQPGSIIKSDRGLSSEEKKLLLRGRPSFLYEVDHIIPLWAGGADTAANWEVLSRPDHDKKTKAQAVPYVLWANGKIPTGRARFYAMSWKDRDLSKVPSLDENGLIPLETAQEIKSTWDKQASEVPKVTFKDFLKAIPVAGREAGEKLDKATENLSPFVQGAVKGLASGLTGTWIRYSSELNNRGAPETAGNIAGSIGGMLIPIGAFMKVFGIAGRGLQAMNVANNLKNSGVVGRAAVSTAQGTRKGIERVRIFRGSADPQKVAFAKVATDNFLKLTPALVTYGQITESFEETSQRGKRFVEDIIYGGLTGFVRPTLTGSLNVGVAAMITAFMFSDSEDPVTEALITGITMAALHGATSPGIKKQVKAETFKVADQELTRASYNIFNAYLGDKRMPFIKPNSLIPKAGSLSREQVVALRRDTREKLFQMAYGTSEEAVQIKGKGFVTKGPSKYMDLDSLDAELKRIEASGEWLEMRTLPPKERDARMMQNVYSIIQQTKGGIVLPPNPPILKKVVADMPENLFLNKLPAGSQTGKYPTGVMKATGLANNFNLNPEKLKFFIEAKAKGQASPTLIAFRRTDTEAHFREMSNNPALKWTDSDPANTIQIYGVVADKGGARSAVDLGYWPQAKRISGEKFSFNSQKEIKSGQFPAYKTELNKDAVGRKMNEEGLDYLYLNLEEVGYTKGNEAFPFLEFSFSGENWARSLAAHGRPSVSQTGAGGRNLPAIIDDVNKSLNAKKRQQSVKEINQAIKKPADELLEDPSAQIFEDDPAGAMALHTVTRNGREALEQETPEALAVKMKSFFGMELDDVAAKKVFNRRNDMDVKNMFSLVSENSIPPVRAMFNDTVVPFLTSPVFRNWRYGKSFLHLKVVGGIKPRVDAVTPTTITLPKAAPAAPVKAGATQAQVVKVSPLVDKIVAKADIITPTAKTTPVSLQPKQPTQTQPSLDLPPTEVAKPLVSETIPQTKQEINRSILKVFGDSARDMEIRGLDIIDNMQVPAERPQYVRQLKSAIFALDPAGRVPTAKEARRFTTGEKASINKKVKNRLTLRAEQLVEQAFNIDNEIGFKVGGIGEGDELYTAMRGVIKADTLRGLGSFDEAKSILDNLPVKEKDRALELLKIKFPSITPKAPAKAPDTQEYKELRQVQNTMHKQVGETEIKTIREGMQVTDDPYKRARAVALDTAFGDSFKRAGLDYKSPEGLKLMGVPFSDMGLSKKVGLFKKSSLKDLFVTHRTEGDLKPISHTEEYLLALGKGDKKAMEVATTKRKEQLETFQKDKDLGLLDSKEDLITPGGGIEARDLGAEGGLRLLSPTQDIGQVTEINKVYTKLYPALNASVVSGKELTAADGVRDAQAYFSFMIGEINKFLKATKQEKSISLGFLKGKDPAFYAQPDAKKFEFNAQETTSYFRNILDKLGGANE